MSCVDELINFCNKHRRVFIYGAGFHAISLMHFFDDVNIIPEACVVSGENLGEAKLNGKIKIYTFNKYNFGDFNDVGIVIAMQSIFFKDVKKNICEKIGTNVDCFFLDDSILLEIKNQIIWNSFFKEINKNYNINKYNVHEFKEKIDKIKSNFSGVKICLLEMCSIGSSGNEWIRFVEEQHNCSEYFNLCYPVTGNHDSLNGYNSYFLSKCYTDKGEVLCWANIAFWSYFFITSRDFFSFEDNLYSHSNSANRVNSFILRHPLNAGKSYISFNDAEVNEGEKKIHEMGINGSFICFAGRDSAYDKKVQMFVSDSTLLTAKYRNMKVENLRKAMEHLEKDGMKAVRMGAVVENRIEWGNTVDYASNFRTEFMDFYLMSKCNFFVSNVSGIQSIAHIFSKPLVVISNPFFTVRYDYLLYSYVSRDLLINRKYWNPEKERYLYLSEILQYETDASLHERNSVGTARLYERDGIIMEENTPQEIDDVVQEMVLREKGEIEYSAEDEDMQKEFQNILNSFPLGSNLPLRFRIGREFMRQNPWLLK